MVGEACHGTKAQSQEETVESEDCCEAGFGVLGFLLIELSKRHGGRLAPQTLLGAGGILHSEHSRKTRSFISGDLKGLQPA